MNPFEPTKEQEKAFQKVVAAIKAAKKLGLSFYGRQGSLAAQNAFVEKYEKEHGFDHLLQTGAGQLPCLTANVLNDSGADDYPCYASSEDEQHFQSL